MQKTYFHNNKSISENNDQTKTISIQNIGLKDNVDINKLLNRVKIEKKNESKKQVIFYTSTILVLSTFIYIVI
tara:strand:- start:249 stop:467 length:219 start_codon:yes stop_codon:yes gene_type:complete